MASVKNIISSVGPAERHLISEFIVQRWLENASLKDLERFFVDANHEMLDELNDAELIGTLEDTSTDEEFEQFMKDILEPTPLLS